MDLNPGTRVRINTEAVIARAWNGQTGTVGTLHGHGEVSVLVWNKRLKREVTVFVPRADLTVVA